jgi:hypothetical protein
MEYIPNATSFFERMRQLEEGCDQTVGVFSPVSYLLTSEGYDRVLGQVLRESVANGSGAEDAGTIDRLLAILQARKENFRRRRPMIASILSSVDLERFLRDGLEGRYDLPAAVIAERRLHALEEVRHIAAMLRDQAIGVQIGIAREPIPATSFQIMRQNGRATLTISPFRLGQQPNIRIGVGLVTTAPEALALHDGIVRRLWDTSLRGTEAASHIDGLIARFGIAGAAAPSQKLEKS